MAFLKEGPRIQWTERDRVVLIETIIQVEEEIRHKSSLPIQPPTTHREMGKWDRVNYLLPRRLQGRTQSENSKYRCRNAFAHILTRYRAPMRPKRHQSDPVLTIRVFELIKKREYLLNSARTLVGSKRSLKSNSTSGNVMSTTSTPSNKCTKSSNTLAVISVTTSDEGPHHYGKSEGSRPSLVRESKDPEDFGKAAPRPQTRISRMTTSQDLSSRRKSSTSMARRRYEEPLQGLSDGSPRRLGVEFSHLRSWVEKQLILLGKNDFLEITISAIRCNRGKLSVGLGTQPFDNLLNESVSKTMDLHIQTMFQNLRVRFAQILKQMSVEIAEVFLQDTPSV